VLGIKMSSARKPLPPDPATPTRRPPASNNSNSAPKTPSKSAAPSASSDTVQANGLARTPSLRKENVPLSARAAAARRAANRVSVGLGSTSALPEDGAEDDARAEHAQLVAELKEQLQRAEFASDQYQKQLEVLQLRLDEVLIDQSRLEEQGHQRDAEIQILQANAKEFARQRKEMEQFHEAEKALILKERDQHASKEEELQVIIRRLNDTIRQRDIRLPDASPSGRSSPRPDSETFAPLSPTSPEEPSGESQQLQQRDRMIESLRLELVDAQIKLTEMEHMGDGRLQELEKQLLEARMTNARLLEDNESYQLLLSEKTLKGDFMNDSGPSATGLGSLADELESAQKTSEGESEAYRKLEAEAKSLRDGNKALTLYIDRIIGRLLQHEGFEHIIHEKNEPPEVPSKTAATEKALPPAPAPAPAPAAAGPSFLQRAKSVVSRPAAPPKARPLSLAQPPTAHENPNTAPSIPLARAHRRSRSDQIQSPEEQSPMSPAPAAAVVGQMYRGSPLRTISGGPTSQGISPALSPSLGPTRTSYFPPGQSLTGRAPSGGPPAVERSSSSNSFVSEQSGDMHSTDASSAAPVTATTSNSIPGAVMKQNQLRPLRLVREQAAAEDEEAAKKSNRTSWFGFFKGTSLETGGKAEP
jgi:hypothetical protein